MKRILIGTLIFLVYLALVIFGGFALHFEGVRLALFIIVLGLLGLAATVFAVWYLNKLAKESGGVATSNSPEDQNLQALLNDANLKIRNAGRAGVKSLAALPLIYVIGDENSAKTQTVLQSGLDPELIAGAVYRDQNIAPTQSANIWLAGDSIIAEAGGALLRQPGLWQRLIKATLPARMGSVFAKDSRLPARSVVVCVSIERILAPNTAEQIRALAQTLNERLRQLSQTLGITLPVYVLFTKLDAVAPFADYMGRLTEEEVKFPMGALLSALGTDHGLYSETATATLSAHYDRLLYALGEFRLDLLSRGGELQELARAYEFPRDLRKVRTGIVSFLMELARPSQIGVNPFLRGFFFTGMRAHMVEDILDVGPAQQQAIAAPAESGATRIFSMASMQNQPAPVQQPRRGGSRKVPQWVFLPHLFSKILLADKSALETSRSSTRTNLMRRILLACTSVVILTILLFTTISFFKNRSLEDRVASAAATQVTAVSSGAIASRGDLDTLEKLRAVLDELDQYRKDGPPFLDRWGLYRGEALYPVACQAYSNKFRSLLLNPTQENILAKLRALPAAPSPESDYSATYRPLKAYLITVSNPNPDSPQDTLEFLSAALMSEWSGNATADPAVAQLVKTQFDFYARLLSAPSSCMARIGGSSNEPTVARTRVYLNGFQGFQHVYQSMLSAANRKVPGVEFNSKYPGSVQYIVDGYTVQGAFTKDGFTFMQDAILHPDPYFRGEEWVLGPSTGAPIDRAALSSQLHTAYFADYLQTWRTYLNRAQFVPYKNFPEAGVKLSALDSNTSAILELFSLISANTGVAAPEIAGAFQAPQTVVTPSSPDSRLIGATNQAYIQSLQALEGAVKNLTLNPAAAADPNAAAPVMQAAVAAEQAAETLRNTFTPDPGGNMDKTSFAILQAPIEATKNLASQAPAQAAGGAAKTFCGQISPVMSKFPFNPSSAQEATPDEVAQVFSPGQGAFAQFTNNSLRTLVVQQGGQYAPIPGSPVKTNPAFLTFLNHAQKISSTLFPAGGNQPSLDFTLTEVKSGADADLNIDGKQLKAGGQSASFHWVSSPSSRITLNTQKNTAPPMSGPWAVFHFGFAAPQAAPNRLKFFFSFNNQTPEVVLFDASGSGAALLNPEFMKGFRCVSAVAR